MNTHALQVHQVSKWFGGLAAVHEVSLALRRGEIFSVVGPNGAGKTTLINLITAVYRADAGRIVLQGRDLTGLTPDRIARLGVARTFQQPRLFWSMSVLENCMVGAFRHASCGVVAGGLRLAASRQAERRAREFAWQSLRRVGLELVAEAPAGTLTTGQQRLLEVARALASDPLLILLDEPAAGLTDTERHALGALCLALTADGPGILLVEHDMDLVVHVSDRVLVMNDGRPVAVGPPREMMRHPDVVACFLGTDGADPRA